MMEKSSECQAGPLTFGRNLGPLPNRIPTLFSVPGGCAKAAGFIKVFRRQSQLHRPSCFLLVPRQYDVGPPTRRIEEIAVVVVRAGMDPKRVARPVIMNTTDRPTTDDVTGYAGLNPTTIFPEGQVVNPGKFEVLWMVEGRDRLFTVSVIKILGIYVVVSNRRVSSRQRLREGVGG